MKTVLIASNNAHKAVEIAEAVVEPVELLVRAKQEAARRREQTLKDAQAACDALRSSARLSEAAAEIVRRVVER